MINALSDDAYRNGVAVVLSGCIILPVLTGVIQSFELKVNLINKLYDVILRTSISLFLTFGLCRICFSLLPPYFKYHFSEILARSWGFSKF